MSKLSTLQKFRDNLFDDIDKLDITPAEKDKILRYRLVISLRLENPSITNKALVATIKENSGLSASQAYRDIADIEGFIASITNAQKGWNRYVALETFKEVISKARECGDLTEMNKAAANIAKYSRLDKEDADPIPYGDIVVPVIEFAEDPSILGVDVKDPRELVERVKRKYITDVEFTEVKDGS